MGLPQILSPFWVFLFFPGLLLVFPVSWGMPWGPVVLLGLGLGLSSAFLAEMGSLCCVTWTRSVWGTLGELNSQPGPFNPPQRVPWMEIQLLKGPFLLLGSLAELARLRLLRPATHSPDRIAGILALPAPK